MLWNAYIYTTVVVVVVVDPAICMRQSIERTRQQEQHFRDCHRFCAIIDFVFPANVTIILTGFVSYFRRTKHFSLLKTVLRL